MEHLIKSMLDVATIEAGTFSVVLVPCTIEDLLRETMEMLQPCNLQAGVTRADVVSPGWPLRPITSACCRCSRTLSGMR